MNNLAFAAKEVVVVVPDWRTGLACLDIVVAALNNGKAGGSGEIASQMD